ncbi:MAG: hypothetical protein LBK61_06900 [Spirochaetaceae bacterium]|nr:hypothetical protein [Spirochaetaceae bacterium]
MKKGKKFFAVAAALLLGASLFFIGCETEPEEGTEEGGGEGSEPEEPTSLTGNKTAAEIAAYLKSAGPFAFEGVVQTDGGMVFIPAGKNVELAGAAAYTGTTNSILILEDASSVAGEGKLKKGNGVIVAPEAVAAAHVDGGTDNAVILLSPTEPIVTTGAVIAVKPSTGTLTISSAATSSTNITTNTQLENKTLYVVGAFTVSGSLYVSSGSVNVVVTGDVTVSESQSDSVHWKIGGNLTATKSPLSGSKAGSLDVTGNADITTLNAADGAGAVNIGGDAKFSQLETKGPLTIGGNTTFASTVHGKIGGATTFGGNVTLEATKDLEFTGTETVTLKAGKNINDVLVAGSEDVVLTPTATAKLAYAAAGNKITLDTENLALTSGELSIPAGKEFFTKKQFTVGTALTVDGTLSIADSADAKVLLTNASTKVVLNADSTLDVGQSGKFGTATPTDTKISVAASSAPGTPTKAKSEKNDETWTITTDGNGADFSSDDSTPILGNVKIAVNGSQDVNGVACADNSDSTAAGKLKAGSNTTITFTGTGDN